jgi:MFS family permease
LDSLIKASIQLFTLIAIAANIGSGFAPTYPGQIVTRCFAGVGASVVLSIGGATVRYILSRWTMEFPGSFRPAQICDMFFQGERGRFIGFYALAITNGVSDAFYGHIYFEPQC